jgi:UDP-glucose 4-epimerase
VSINELARRVNTMTGSSSPIVHIPYEEIYGASFEDMNRRVPDLTKIREFVGFEPTTTLDELLRITVDHIRRGLDGDATVFDVAPATTTAVRSSS